MSRRMNVIEKKTFELYDEIKRFQSNIDESLAVTLIFIYNCYTKQQIYALNNEDKGQFAENLKITPEWYKDEITNDVGAEFIATKTAEYLADIYPQYSQEYSKFSKKEIKNVLKNLINNKSELLQSSSRKTNTNTKQLISSIAKNLPYKNYIDLAIGTGSLLDDLNGKLYGIDVNPKLVVVAKIYLFFCEKEIDFDSFQMDSNIRIGDAITEYPLSKTNNIVLFDPPMGDYRKYPQLEEWQKTNILESKKPVKLQSELLFLLSFLINADNNDYFIGLFPENILTKNNKDYISIRKYLVKNSLIAVIKVLEAHVILIGKKKLNADKYKKIPVIRIQSRLNEKQLDYISSEIIKGENYDFDKYFSIEPSEFGTIIKEYDSIESYNKDFRNITHVIYNRQDLKNNYIINLPSKLSYEDIYKNQTKSPKELLTFLQEKENTIKILMQNLSENIANTEFYSDNIEEEQKPLWFEEYDEKQDPELINALNYFYKIGYQLTQDNINDYHDFQIRENINADSYFNLKVLYKDGRVKLLKNKAKIYFGKDEKLKIKKIDLNEFYKSFEPLQDPNVSKILDMVTADNNIRLVFEDLCKYYMLDQDEDATLLKKKALPIKEFTRCLKVLENLGLVIYDKRKVAVSEQGHSDIDLYKRSIPNIKYVYAIKFEEMQDV